MMKCFILILTLFLCTNVQHSYRIPVRDDSKLVQVIKDIRAKYLVQKEKELLETYINLKKGIKLNESIHKKMESNKTQPSYQLINEIRARKISKFEKDFLTTLSNINIFSKNIELKLAREQMERFLAQKNLEAQTSKKMKLPLYIERQDIRFK